LTLFAESLAYLMRSIGNGLAGGIGSVAEPLPYVLGTAAYMALAETRAGGVEILVRGVGLGVAGGKEEQGREQQGKAECLFHAAIMPPRQ
jgi:hypothetical protein